MIRTDIEPEVGEMDPKLAEALNAFGASRYDESRKLAQDLISASTDSSTRAECVGIIILSHLDQGEFDGAREAAERLRTISPDVCQDLLAQVNREERDYQAEVSRLQQIVATAQDPNEAALAQLQTARMHQAYGRLDVAEKSYRKVVETYPASHSAALAVRRAAGVALASRDFEAAKAIYLEAMEKHPSLLSRADGMERIADVEVRSGHMEQAVKSYWSAVWAAPDSARAAERVVTMERLAWRGLTPEYARELGKAVADEAPNSDLASAACQQLFDLASADGKVQYGETRATFEKIASDHPDAQGSDTARFLIGKLYAAEGQYEAAEGTWAALIAERPKAKEAADTRVGLADVRYSLGMKAFTDRDYEKAAEWLGRLFGDIEMLAPRSVGVRMETTKAGRLRSDQRYVVFSFGEACEKLGRWQEAAGAYERLATRGNPAEEIALAKLVRCYINMGDRARARSAYDELTKRFPDSPRTREAQKLL